MSDYARNLVTFISIHAPTRGATCSHAEMCDLAFNFNPRSHKGSDIGINIIGVYLVNFNPRSHKGSDLHANFGIENPT